MISLVNAMGLSTGLEKLLVSASPATCTSRLCLHLTLCVHSQPHLTHRVWRVREQVLHALQRVVQLYGADVIIAPDLPRQLSALMADPQSSVRQLAMGVLCDLHSTFGESMMVSARSGG